MFACGFLDTLVYRLVMLGYDVLLEWLLGLLVTAFLLRVFVCCCCLLLFCFSCGDGIWLIFGCFLGMVCS